MRLICKKLLINHMPKIWACMAFFLKIGTCMVSKSENTKRKFEVESKEETVIQEIVN